MPSRLSSHRRRAACPPGHPWRHLPLACVLAVLLGACAGPSASSDHAPLPGASQDSRLQTPAPELVKVDERLIAIDQEIQAMRNDLNDLQERVGAHMGDAGANLYQLEYQGGQLYLEIDQRSLLRVNGIAMGQDDFYVFARNRSASLCSPTPILVVHPEANYDVVAWVLEAIYSQGCSSVDISENRRANP